MAGSGILAPNKLMGGYCPKGVCGAWRGAVGQSFRAGLASSSIGTARGGAWDAAERLAAVRSVKGDQRTAAAQEMADFCGSSQLVRIVVTMPPVTIMGKTADFCGFRWAARIMADYSRSVAVSIDLPRVPLSAAPIDGGAAPLSILSAIPMPIAQSAAGLWQERGHRPNRAMPRLKAGHGHAKGIVRNGVGGQAAARSADGRDGSADETGPGAGIIAAREGWGGLIRPTDCAAAMMDHGAVPVVSIKGTASLCAAFHHVN